MSNILQIVEDEQTSEFYPTPQSLVEKMLEGIDWRFVHTILEPSAGKGDILREIAKKEDRHKDFDVDCIEIDANLRQILKYNFSDEREKAIRYRQDDVKEKYNSETRKYEFETAENRMEWYNLKEELKTFFKKGIHIVHDNFLTYTPYKKYDLIIMNPPFSNGDKHLLKALQIQKKGGNIICLLNAETLYNPYTESRRELVRQLKEYGAEVEYIDNAFISAERKTGVEVALIKVAIPQAEEQSDIYEHMKKAEQMEDVFDDVTDLEVTDYIKAAIVRFNVEVKAGLELIRQFRALKPFMTKSFGNEPYDKDCILRLTDTYDRSYSDVSINDYLRATRLKYWRALLSNDKFTSKLTSTLQTEYRERVAKLADYDFTEFNISTLVTEMNAQIKTGIEDEIIKMFDRLTAEHTWYPECQKNKHYYNGWKTNKAHKIGKKVIIPHRGIFSEYSDRLYAHDARGTLEDIERILNFLDGGMTMEIDSWRMIENAFNQRITKNIRCKYFNVTFYKKGTAHLTFTCPELIERFNIYAAQYKQWLPPNYGKTTYNNMTPKEKAVIDSFQGEKAYNEVMAKSSYYLAPVTNNQMLRLEG